VKLNKNSCGIFWFFVKEYLRNEHIFGKIDCIKNNEGEDL